MLGLNLFRFAFVPAPAPAESAPAPVESAPAPAPAQEIQDLHQLAEKCHCDHITVAMAKVLYDATWTVIPNLKKRQVVSISVASKFNDDHSDYNEVVQQLCNIVGLVYNENEQRSLQFVVCDAVQWKFIQLLNTVTSTNKS